MAAMTAAEVVDGLSGKRFGRETGAGDDDLAVFVLVTGVGGLKSGHFYRDKGRAYSVNQMARSSSLRLPSARWRNMK